MTPLLALLVACRTPESPADQDADRDGWPSPTDCDDSDPSRNPGAQEIGDNVDRDCDGAVPPPPGTVTGGTADGGAGSAVLQVDGTTWAGAPWAQPLIGRWPAGGWRMQDRRGVERSMDGAPGDALGAAFAALEDGTVLVGAPGVGEVRDAVTGEVRYRAPGAGGRLAARGSAWITRTHAGVVRVDPDATVEVVTPSRAESLLVWDDTTWIVGMPTGDVAILILRADGGSHAIARAPAPVGAYPDEAGWALAACDLDQDGQRELLVGAPGAGRVLRVDDLTVTTLSTANVLAAGTGRFGAALACDRNALWVGAPMAGPEAQGAVHAMRDGTVRLLLEGDATDAQLGFALHAADDVLVAGAPGASGTPGRALRVLP